MARALVTGSTSGLGLEFAWQLAGTGHDLVLVARDADRLPVIARQIAHVHDVRIETLVADVADRRQLEKVATRLTDPVDPVDLLVNSTGYTLRGAFLEFPIEEHERQAEILVRAVLVLSHAAARTMAQRRRGAIINVSSLAGFTAGGALAASKSWVTVFTESLAAELEGTGVTATALLPGLVQSAGAGGAAVTREGVPRVTWQKAPYIVEQGLRDAARGLALSIPSVRVGEDGASAGTVRGARWALLAITPRRVGLRIIERRLVTARRRASRRRLHAPWARDDDSSARS